MSKVKVPTRRSRMNLLKMVEPYILSFILLLEPILFPDVSNGGEDYQQPSLFPSPNFDLNGDDKIQGVELALIHSNLPQFILISCDDNGHEEGLEFLKEIFTEFGIEDKVTYFLTGDYRTEGPKYTGGRIEELWRDLILSGKVALHTMTHPDNGHLLSLASWLYEQETLQEYIMQNFFLPFDKDWNRYPFGSRAPVLRYNKDYFFSLMKLKVPVLYDASIDVGDESYPENSNFYATTFPYTLDNGASADSFPSLLPPDYKKKAEVPSVKGMWEVPIYMWYHKGRWTSSYDLNIWMDFGFRIPPSSPEALEMLLNNLKFHLHGNRAPFTFGIHPQNFVRERKEERLLIRNFFEEVRKMIRKGERIEFISYPELINWMKDFTPPSVELLSKDNIASEGKKREIRIKVHDDTFISQVSLFYRSAGIKNFKKLDFKPLGNGVMNCVIPKEDIKSRAIQYYIYAVDSRLNSTTLPKDSFYSISVLKKDEVPPSGELHGDFNAGTGEPLSFDAYGVTDNTAIKEVTWDMDLTSDSDGDGNPENDVDGTGLKIIMDRGFPLLGKYAIRCRIEDISSLKTEITREVFIDHFYFKKDFSDWTALSGGPSYDRIRIGKKGGLRIFLDGSWWFAKGTRGVAEYVFPIPVERIKILYIADLNPLISAAISADDRVFTRLHRGFREKEVKLEKPAKRVTVTFELVGDIEKRDSSFLRIEELKAWPSDRSKENME